MCGCNSGASTFEVTLPDGTVEEVKGEVKARARASATGGTWRKK